MKKYSKEDLKSPDIATQELQQGFGWMVRHGKLVGLLLFAFVVLGGAVSIFQIVSENKESGLQEQYFKIEKEYTQKKESFAPPAPGEKAPATPAAKATGDLAKDYADLNVKFEALIQQSPESKAAAMSALLVSELYTSYQQKQKALDAVSKFKGSGFLLATLVQDRKAGLQADLGDCKGALATWDALLANKSAAFMASEVKLKKALCYENLKDFAQAQTMYKQIMDADKNSTLAKSAEKYLQLLPQTSNN